jgi:hypothetical protein
VRSGRDDGDFTKDSFGFRHSSISIFSTSRHCASASPPVNHAKRSSREKVGPPSTYVAGRLRMPTCSQLCCSAGSTARELNAAIICESLERRLAGGALSPFIIHAFDVPD